MPQRRVTIRDISQKTGLGIATVSRALNNSEQISEETKQNVLKAAQEMGYKKDAMLSALTQHRWTQENSSIEQTIAWIDCWSLNDPPYSFNSGGIYDLFYQGAKEQALRMGYRLETYRARHDGMTDERLSQILYNKGTIGVIIPPVPLSPENLGSIWGEKCDLKLDWENFCIVRIGYSYKEHPFNTVISAQFHCIEKTINSLVNLGYKNIGYITFFKEIERNKGHFIGAFEYCKIKHQMNNLRLKSYVPEYKLEEKEYASIKQWIKEKEIQVVIGTQYQTMNLIRNLGYSIPDELGYVHLAGGTKDDDIALMDQNGKTIGKTCIKVLHSMILNNEKGIPQETQETLIHPTWKMGKSVRTMVEIETNDAPNGLKA